MREVEWVTACPDWEEKIMRGESIIPPPIFPDMANYALNIFGNLRIPDLAGKPTFFDVSAPWVFDLVKAVFGAYNQETGEQLIKNFFVLMGKKNGKSTLAAGIMMTALILCWREEEEHLILAPTKEVSDASFTAAGGMVRAEREELGGMFYVRDHLKTIQHISRHNSLKVIASDTKTAAGKKAGRILIDEIHEFGAIVRAETIFTEATGGQVARPEGFTIMLSTQSAEPPAGVFKERLEYFRKVRDGEIHDPKSLPVIFEFPKSMIEDGSYLEPKNFFIPNPNLGYSVSLDWLESNLEKAKLSSDNQFQNMIAKHLNVQIGLNLVSDRWAGADFWESSAISLSLESLVEQSEVIDIGIDGGGLDDLLGFYVIGRRPDGSKLGWGFAWCGDIALERRRDIASRLKDFESDGELEIVRDIGKDVKNLVDICVFIREAGKLDKIGIDPAGVGAILDELEKKGFTDKDIVGIPQGWKLGGAIKTAERWLATKGAFSPAKQGLMAWCVGNAKVEQRANGILITKQKSGSGKIDPLMAMFNAVALMSLNPKAPGKKYGMFFI